MLHAILMLDPLQIILEGQVAIRTVESCSSASLPCRSTGRHKDDFADIAGDVESRGSCLGESFIAGEGGVVFLSCELGFVAELGFCFLFCFSFRGFLRKSVSEAVFS
jgi:hypothetical protein